MTINLNEMTTEEKLKAMEELWDDICRNVPDLSSPKWHGNILKKREEVLKEGKDRFINWEQAKKDIRDSI